MGVYMCVSYMECFGVGF